MHHCKSLILDYELPCAKGKLEEERIWESDIGSFLGARYPLETWYLWRYIKEGGAVHVGAYVKYTRRHMIYPGTLQVRGVRPQLWLVKNHQGYRETVSQQRGWGNLGYDRGFMEYVGGRSALKRSLRGLVLHGNPGVRVPGRIPEGVVPPTIDPAKMVRAWGKVRAMQEAPKRIPEELRMKSGWGPRDPWGVMREQLGMGPPRWMSPITLGLLIGGVVGLSRILSGRD